MWYYLGKNKNTGNTGNKIQEKFSGLLVIGKIQELCEWLEISFPYGSWNFITGDSNKK